jgi:hypothetical protein
MVYTTSGSEAVESAVKIALQYHFDRGDPGRVHFIARKRSWHGNTLMATALSGFEDRQRAFAGALPTFGLSDYMFGILLTAGIVLVYTTIGGFLAVSLTDFVQGVIMMVALVIMPLVIFFGADGAPLASVPQEGFLSLTQGATFIGVVSAVTWGLGYF